MLLSAPSDTIVAIATAPGEGAIAIVRVSGPQTYTWADQLFRCPSPLPSARKAGTFVHGQVIHPETHEVLDDALLLLFRAPHSYTAEDSIEIHCHGGSQVAHRVLSALQALGARQAEPGEFTKRAFLNEKMDLTQAEAVLDLIHARSERAARLATAQLEDSLGQRIRSLYDTLLAVAADIESMLDFPDDELPQSVIPDIIQRLTAASSEMNELLDTWSEGHVLREGARIVIAGAPNVGKSTLLNRLAGRDRAIVSHHPGTTRDTIEETITIQGYPIHLTDTAGLRDAPCEIELEGIRRTHDALAQADLCICIVDASSPLTPEEKSFIESHSKSTTLVLLNKSDLGQRLNTADFQDYTSLTVSLKQNESITPILDQILGIILHQTASTDHGTLAISDRHKELLISAVDNVTKSSTQLESGLESDFLLAATHIRSAVEQVGNIFGKDCSEELMDTIFSRFCVGK
jgi:tRNA modification GTPase